MKKVIAILSFSLLSTTALFAETNNKTDKAVKAAPVQTKQKETASLARAYKREFCFLRV